MSAGSIIGKRPEDVDVETGYKGRLRRKEEY